MTNARTKVTTANTELLLDNSIVKAMIEASPQKVGAMRKRIADYIADRKGRDSALLADGETLSKDFVHLEDWIDNDALARFFIASNVDPKGYILNPYLDDAELIKRGFSPDARTKNLKAYKKVREVAEYVVSGQSKLEAVFKTFVACAIIASKSTEVIPRNVCERFLSSIPLTDVSADLAEAIEAFQAKHMTGGAATQTSQMTLTLANLGAASVIRDGRSKNFALKPESGLIQALAERFGMQKQVDNLTA